MSKEEKSPHLGPAWSQPQITPPVHAIAGCAGGLYFSTSLAAKLGSSAWVPGNGQYVRVLCDSSRSSHQVPCMILHYLSAPPTVKVAEPQDDRSLDP